MKFVEKTSIGGVGAEISFIQLYLPSKRLINVLDAREGARRFEFLLETCKPGQLPDAPLIAALLELVCFYVYLIM